MHGRRRRNARACGALIEGGAQGAGGSAMSPKRRNDARRPRRRPTERDRSLPPLTTEPGKASHKHAIEPGVQSMGGKEERVSDVGRARAEVERLESEGEERFDIVPGPSAQE